MILSLPHCNVLASLGVWDCDHLVCDTLLVCRYIQLFQRKQLFTSSGLKKLEAAGTSKTVVPVYKTRWHHIPIDHNLNTHCHEDLNSHVITHVYHIVKIVTFSKIGKWWSLLYKGWNFNFGNTPLDWIQELLEWCANAAGRMGPSPTYIHNGSGPSRNGHTQ